MASGSQVWSGSWADLPRAPPRSRAAATVAASDPGAHNRPARRAISCICKGAEARGEQEQADGERGIPDAGHHEGLDRRTAVCASRYQKPMRK